MNVATATDGMIVVEEFAKTKGITPDVAIDRIRDGTYEGKVVNGQWYARAGQRSRPSSTKSDPASNTPTLIAFLNAIAVLGLMGGVVGAFLLWPNISLYGDRLPPLAYAWSISSIVAGVTQALLLHGLATILSYVHRIDSKLQS